MPDANKLGMLLTVVLALSGTLNAEPYGWGMAKNCAPRQLPAGHPLAQVVAASPPPEGEGGGQAEGESLPAFENGVPAGSTQALDELALTLRSDPALVFHYIRHNFEFTPYFGYLKGPLLTYHDRAGNDCDLAVLLARLLERCPSASNVTVCYGIMTIPNDVMRSWLRVTTDKAADDLLWSAGWTHDTTPGHTVLERFWVQATVNGQSFQLDPAMRQHQWVPGLSDAQWTAAMGYDRAAMLSAFGGTISGTAVTGLNVAGLKTHLEARLTALMQTINTSHAHTSVRELFGYWKRTVPSPFAVPQLVSGSLGNGSFFPTTTLGTGYPGDDVTHGITLEPAGLSKKRYRIPELAGRQVALVYDGDVPAEASLPMELVSWTPSLPAPVASYDPPSSRFYDNFGKFAPFSMTTLHSVEETESASLSSITLGIDTVGMYSKDGFSFSVNGWITPLTWWKKFDPNGRNPGEYWAAYKAQYSYSGHGVPPGYWWFKGYTRAIVTKGHLAAGSFGRSVTATVGTPRVFDCWLADNGVAGDPVRSITAVSIKGANTSKFAITSQNNTTGQFIVTANADTVGTFNAYLEISMTRDEIPYVLKLPLRSTVVAVPVARLKVDGEVLMSEAGPSAAGLNATFKMGVDHPYGGANDSRSYSVEKTGHYVVCMNFGCGGRYSREIGRQLTELQHGGSATDEQLLLKSLQSLGESWVHQKAQWANLMAERHQVRRINHHTVGLAGQVSSFYVDFANSVVSCPHQADGLDSEDSYAYFVGSSLLCSALEHGVIEQSHANMPAASTCRMLELAAQGNVPIHMISEAGAFSPAAFPTYPSGFLTQVQEYLNDGRTVVMPLDGKIAVAPGANSWKGYGVEVEKVESSLTMLISGGYNGGYAGYEGEMDPQYLLELLQGHTMDPYGFFHSSSPEPVDLVTGNYLYDHVDLHVGADAPKGVVLKRSYSSGRAGIDRGLGPGWDHNWNCHINITSNPDLMWGKRRPVDAAPALVAAHCLMDLNSMTTPTVTSKVAQSIISNWCVDKIRKNSVMVDVAGKALEFSSHANGTGAYNAPPGNTSTLVCVNAAAHEFTLEERLGMKYYFYNEGAGKPSLRYVFDPDGRHMEVVYMAGSSGPVVRHILDCFNRWIYFTYSGDRIQTASDSSGRTVYYNYDDGSGNLTSFRDPDNNTFHFDYSLPGDPAGQASKHFIRRLRDATTAHATIAEQDYNAAGQVLRQRSYGDAAKQWEFAYSESQTMQMNPLGGADYLYFDERQRQIGTRDQTGRLSTAVFDASDHMIASTNPADETTFYDYDSSNRLWQVRHPDLSSSTQGYDTLHRPTWSVDRTGRKTELYYKSTNLKNRPDEQWVYKSPTTYDKTEITYFASPGALNTAGMPETVKDAAGRAMDYTYDTYGNVYTISQEVEVDNGTTNVTQTKTVTSLFSPLGDLLEVTDRLGIKTRFTYNNRRQQLTKTLDFGGTEAFTITTTYDGNGQVESVSDESGALKRFTYSSQGKPLKTYVGNETTAEADDPFSEITYDERDWAESSISAMNRTVSTSYYDNGWKAGITQSPGSASYARSSSYYYDARGEVQAAVGGGYAVRTSRNILDHTITTSAPFAHTGPGAPGETPTGTPDMVKTFDAEGRMLHLTNYRNNTFSMGYSDKGEQNSITTPLSKLSQTQYNADGSVSKLIEPSAQETTLVYYPKSGRLQTQTDSLGTTTRRYDANGNLTFVSDGTRSIWRTYDNLNRVKTVTDERSYVTGYEYHKNGQLMKITYPIVQAGETAKTVNYLYYKNGLLKSVTDWNSRTTTFFYDDDGLLVRVERPNGTKRKITHNPNGQVETIREELADGKLINFYKLVYDARGQLSNYLAVPPRTQPPPNGAMTATADADNRLETVNGHTLSYDDDGNMLAAPAAAGGALQNYQYDARNRLTADPVATAHAYDVEGRRIAVTEPAGTTDFILATELGLSQVLAEKRPGAGGVRYYVIGGGMVLYEADENDTPRYYHFNQVGSTTAISTASPTLPGLCRMDYTAYGERIILQGTPDTRFCYNGAFGVQRDASGLLHMRARFYSPYLGRFMNADPIKFEGGGNWYAYCGGDPLTKADPEGEFAWMLAGAVIGVAVQGAIDLYRGEASSWQTYAGAAVGGALGGGILGNTGRIAVTAGKAAFAGAVSGAGGNVTTQAANMMTDQQQGFSLTSFAAATGAGAAGSVVGAKVLPQALSYLSNPVKGWIGETMSLVTNAVRGNLPAGGSGVGWQVTLPGQRAVWDWQFRNVFTGATTIVESKFGKAWLTKAQIFDRPRTSNLSIERWTYGFWSGLGGTTGGAAGGHVGNK